MVEKDRTEQPRDVTELHACEKASGAKCPPCRDGYCPDCVAQKFPQHELCEAY